MCSQQDETAGDLQQLWDAEETTPRPVNPARRSWREEPRKPRMNRAAMLLAALLLTIAAVAFALQ